MIVLNMTIAVINVAALHGIIIKKVITTMRPAIVAMTMVNGNMAKISNASNILESRARCGPETRRLGRGWV